MRTRSASTADVEFLADLFLASMREAITAARGRWDVASERAQFCEQLDLRKTLLIQIGERTVGYFMTRPLPNGRTEIHTLCVAVDMQGKGIGNSIMHELMERLRSIELSVLKPNVRARRFYERLGFAQIGEDEHHVRMAWSAS